jgi:hypothetical protein
MAKVDWQFVYQVYKGNWIFYYCRKNILSDISLFSSLELNCFKYFFPKCHLHKCWGCWGYITFREITNLQVRIVGGGNSTGFKNDKIFGKFCKHSI